MISQDACSKICLYLTWKDMDSVCQTSREWLLASKQMLLSNEFGTNDKELTDIQSTLNKLNIFSTKDEFIRMCTNIQIEYREPVHYTNMCAADICFQVSKYYMWCPKSLADLCDSLFTKNIEISEVVAVDIMCVFHRNLCNSSIDYCNTLHAYMQRVTDKHAYIFAALLTASKIVGHKCGPQLWKPNIFAETIVFCNPNLKTIGSLAIILSECMQDSTIFAIAVVQRWAQKNNFPTGFDENEVLAFVHAMRHFDKLRNKLEVELYFWQKFETVKIDSRDDLAMQMMYEIGLLSDGDSDDD